MFTVPLDDSHSKYRRSRWHDYMETSFYVVLADQTVGFTSRAISTTAVQFSVGSNRTRCPCRPAAQLKSSYSIQPSPSAAESIVSRVENETELHLTKTLAPGNYAIADEDGTRVAAFSVNVAPEESILTRVPVEQIEDLLGGGSVLPIDFKTNLHDALMQRWSQPVELFPWLMILLLLLLAVENLLANRFYRRNVGPQLRPLHKTKL